MPIKPSENNRKQAYRDFLQSGKQRTETLNRMGYDISIHKPGCGAMLFFVLTDCQCFANGGITKHWMRRWAAMAVSSRQTRIILKVEKR